MAATMTSESEAINAHFQDLLQDMKNQTCIVNHSVFYDKNADEMVVKTGASSTRYKHHRVHGFTDLLDSGFTVSEKWACTGNHVIALIISKQGMNKGSKNFMIVFCDDLKKEIIGTAPVVYKNQDCLQYVEVFSCALSPDRSMLGFVLGVLDDIESSTQVYFYDTTYWLQVRVFEGQPMIPPAFAFHPSYHHSMVVLLGLQEEPLVELYSLQSGADIKSTSVDFYNVDGETSLQLSFTGDGRFLICQVIENLGYNIGFMGRSYILHTDTLKVAEKPKPKAFLAPTCHPECDPQILPLFSKGFRHMALPVKNKNKVGTDLQVYKLPHVMRLKEMCRQEINEVRRGSTCVVNISDELKDYLNYKPTMV